MGGINFGWLAVLFPSPDWLCRILEECDVCQVLRWNRHAWGRECGPCPDFASNTLAFVLQLRKITENLSQGNRMALGYSAPTRLRFVDLAIAGDGLDCPAVPCRPWLSCQATGSTLGQRIFRVAVLGGFPTSANLESKLSARVLIWSANIGTPRSSCIWLLLTYQGELKVDLVTVNVCYLDCWTYLWNVNYVTYKKITSFHILSRSIT